MNEIKNIDLFLNYKKNVNYLPILHKLPNVYKTANNVKPPIPSQKNIDAFKVRKKNHGTFVNKYLK